MEAARKYGEHALSSFDQEHKELEAHIQATPPNATVKGMYVDSFLKTLDRSGIDRPTNGRFFTFKDYPLTDWMHWLLESTAKVHPDLPPKEGLRRLGRLVYPTLVSSTVGKVIFSIAGNSFEQALPLSRKAYEVSLKPGVARLEHQGSGRATMALRDVWNFADCYQAGVFEGAMQSFHVRGTVQVVRQKRPCDVDLQLEWA